MHPSDHLEIPAKNNEEDYDASNASTHYLNYNAHTSGLYPPFDVDLEEEFDAVRSIN